MCMQCVRADRREAEGRPARWQRQTRLLFVDIRLDTSRFERAFQEIGLVAERAGIAMREVGGNLPATDPTAPTVAQLARTTDVTPYFDPDSFRFGSRFPAEAKP